MKKRIVSILLCVFMLAGTVMMTGCSISGDTPSLPSDGEETTGSSSGLDRSSMTLSLWLPVKEGTTEEALYAVEEAINRKTQTEFDTAIKLYGIPEDEYDKTIKDRITLLETRTNEAEQKAIDQRKRSSLPKTARATWQSPPPMKIPTWTAITALSSAEQTDILP